MLRHSTRVTGQILRSARPLKAPFYSNRVRGLAPMSTHASSSPSPPGMKRFPLKTILAGLSATSALYLYSQVNQDVVHADADNNNTIPPISAFSLPSPANAVHELMDEENRVSFRSKSTQDILLALFVYKLCSFSWLVDAAPHILKAADTLHMQGPVYWFIRSTFFKYFCGGETADECVSTMEGLARSGINSILDLSIEADLNEDDSVSHHERWTLQEQHSDRVLGLIKKCISTAAKGQEQVYSNSNPFAAVKATAFAPPDLLLRLNQVIVSLDQAFMEYQHNGKLDAAGLRKMVENVLPPPESAEQAARRETVLSKATSLDCIEYRKLFDLHGANRDIWWKTSATSASENDTILSTDELAAYDRMMQRLDEVCSLGHQLRVGIMIDAEQSYFQEAIDHVAMNMQQKYNSRKNGDECAPTVYNTYQMYTKAAQRKLELDVERAKRENFAFAAKLVRGAYMVSERKRAEDYGYPSPIHDTIEDTHASYNGGVKFLLKKLQEHQTETGQALSSATAPIVFMVASHNRDSVVLTVEEMERHSVLPRSGVVHFGQLYAMKDQISYTLSNNGYSIYKYLPYGMIDEVIPYLLRRAQENSSVLGGVTRERAVMWDEVKDRLLGAAPAPVADVSISAKTA